MAKFDTVLDQLRVDSSVVMVEFIDLNSGMKLASSGYVKNADIHTECAVRIVKSELKTIKLLEVEDDIQDIIVATDQMYHLLYPCRGIKDVFIYLIADRSRANLALIRRNLADTEANLLAILYNENDIQNHGLNVKSALDAHCKWRDRLVAMINGTDDSFPLEKASVDNECELGRWLHSVGKSKYADLPEFSKLMNSHRMFHTSVKQVVDVLKSQGVDAAKLEISGSFQKISTIVQNDIITFFDVL
ncbi:CZB domain-containing protein [Salmonella enterica]